MRQRQQAFAKNRKPFADAGELRRPSVMRDTIRLGEAGRLVIPAEMREAMVRRARRH